MYVIVQSDITRHVVYVGYNRFSKNLISFADAILNFNGHRRLNWKSKIRQIEVAMSPGSNSKISQAQHALFILTDEWRWNLVSTISWPAGIMLMCCIWQSLGIHDFYEVSFFGYWLCIIFHISHFLCAKRHSCLHLVGFLYHPIILWITYIYCNARF